MAPGQTSQGDDAGPERSGVAVELGRLLKRHWRWWLPPLLLVLLLVGLLLALDPAPNGPFVYEAL